MTAAEASARTGGHRAFSWRELAAATGIAAVLTVLLTWPIAARFGSGGRMDSGDGRFSIWNVAWVAHALTTDPRHVFDANIFYPATHALAYSESNLVAGLIGVPVWWLTANPYATSNWVILVSFVLATMSAYVLVRWLTGSVAAGAFAGIGYGFSAYAFAHIPHVQLLMTFGPAVALVSMHRFIARPSLGRSIALAAALAIEALACGYYGVFGGLAIALGVCWFGLNRRGLRDWRYWTAAAFVALLTVALTAPFFAPYRAIQAQGFSRTLDDARLFSVGWRAYLATPAWLYSWVLPLIDNWRDVLFPGALTVALAALAFGATMNVGPSLPIIRRDVVGFYVALTGLALWASFGPDAGLYAVLYRVIPLFSFLRAPARFGVIVTLGLTVLGGIGLAGLEPRLNPRLRRLMVGGAIGMAIAGSLVVPLELAEAPPLLEAYQRLQTLPWGPVAEFPFFDGADYHLQTDYMMASTFHWKPLVNGYSDFAPPRFFDEMQTLESFPSPEAFHVLEAHETRYVVMHWQSYPPDVRRRLIVSLRELGAYLRPIVDDVNVSLFEVVAWPQ